MTRQKLNYSIPQVSTLHASASIWRKKKKNLKTDPYFSRAKIKDVSVNGHPVIQD